jgi:uncharacterized SAM-binding protein YcdF (DUF218 family)
VDTLKRFVELLFSPLGVLVLLLACGMALGSSKRLPRVGRRMLACGALLYLVFTFSPLAEFLIRGLERQYPPMLSPPSSQRFERIVVLAGQGQSHPGFPVTSRLSGETMNRLAEGIRLYRRAVGSKLIVSGGVVRGRGEPVAKLMAEFLREQGVAQADVVEERRSRNTYENMVEVKNLVGSSPFVLVTSACDMPRAVAVARRLGMSPLPAPASFWALQTYPANMGAIEGLGAFFTGFAYPSTDRLARLQWAVHEYVGYVWYWLLDRV